MRRFNGDGLDPFPRSYPVAIVLVRRSAGRRTDGIQTFADIEQWLLHDAIGEKDMLQLLQTFMWMLVAANAGIDRFSLHIGTLHPELIGFAWNWNISDGYCDEVRVTATAVASDSYRLNPLHELFTFGEAIRRSPGSLAAQTEFPLMAELAHEGMTDYLALPLCGAGYRNAVTIATRRPDGFPTEQMERLRHVMDLFALHVQRHSDLRVSSNVLAAYLGEGAAAKVLAGSIKRGDGESMRAVIWVSDLRRFTDLSDRLAGPDMLALLNAYFEMVASAVSANGGEILKFIGDGVLAVFLIGSDDQAKTAAVAALSAASQVLAGLKDLGTATPAPLAGIDGWRPLRAGVSIHLGEVFLGNIGSSGRLDFTVIGPAVNEACRVEALQKTLDRDILLTNAVARHLDCPMDLLGEHRLRGVTAPLLIYSPANQA